MFWFFAVCTVLFFGPDGVVDNIHRKLMPTGSERLTRGQGDGSTLAVLDSEISSDLPPGRPSFTTRVLGTDCGRLWAAQARRPSSERSIRLFPPEALDVGPTEHAICACYFADAVAP